MTRGDFRQILSTKIAVGFLLTAVVTTLGPSAASAADADLTRSAQAASSVTVGTSSAPKPARPTLRRVALSTTPVNAPERPGRLVGVDPRTTSSAPALAAYPGRVLATPSAGMAGVTWTGAAPDRVELRYRLPDGTSTPWVVLDLSSAQPGHGSSEPVWYGDATAVEFRGSRGSQDVTSELTAAIVTPDPPTSGTGPELPTASAVTETHDETPADPTSPTAPTTSSVPGPSISPSMSTDPSTTPGGGASSPTAASDQLPGPGPGRASVGAPSLTSLTAPALTVATPLHIYTRAEWGADESLRRADPTYADSLRAAIVHHTDGSNTYSADQVPAILRSIYVYHVQVNGWNDIGYNALVDTFGRVWEGRAGGVDFNVVGAHAAGFNTGAFGISVLGTYTTQSLSAAARESLAQMIAWKFRLNAITDPTGTTVMTSASDSARWPAGTSVTVPRIMGHRDVNFTDCPGNAAYAALPAVRTRVQALMSASPPGPGVPQTLSGATGPISSFTGSARVVLQGDGNLVVYDANGQAQWATMTFVPGSVLSHESDGNLVLRSPAGRPLWTAGVDCPGSTLRIQDDRDLVLYSPSGSMLWDSFAISGNRGINLTSSTILYGLKSGQSSTSPSGGYTVQMQTNGVLALLDGTGAVAWSRDSGVAGSYLVVDAEGNALLDDPTGYPVWTAWVYSPGSYLLVGDDGNFSLFALNGRLLWDRLGRSGNPGRDYKSDPLVWSLAAGATVQSPGGRYWMAMQGDGNLVVYSAAGKAVWATSTFSPGSTLTVGKDGSVRVLDAGGRPLWSSATWSRGAVLFLQEDGNLVLYSASGRALWDIAGGTGKLGVKYSTAALWGLASGSIESNGTAAHFAMQGDGNLVLYDSAWKAVWNSGTFVPGTKMAMGTDGYARLTTPTGAVVWTSNAFSPGAMLVVQGDGNVVVYSADGRAIFDAKGYSGNKGART